jgi:hypothetical protein
MSYVTLGERFIWSTRVIWVLFNDPLTLLNEEGVRLGVVSLVVALRPQTLKHISGGWSHYTDTSEPVDGGVGTLQL